MDTRAWPREKTTEDRWEAEVRPGQAPTLVTMTGELWCGERCADSALDDAGKAMCSLASQASGLVVMASSK